uniref:Uncharacterized protein n=1 Tax=Globisporangium ultimum (strain ATCC 200006 / CBS 805.95 / DAOM BR144) TaxID=431595 RepID=K3XAB7_GLOUD
MGPKRNPKKKNDAPVDRDVLIATNEYPLLTAESMIDTDELHKRVEEAEAQLREEAKIIERMTRDNKSKQEQINSMEAMLQRESEKHQAALCMLEDEHLTQKMHAEHEIEVLNRKVSELELHVEAYDVVESTNVTLRNRVDKLMLQLEHESKDHAEEIHKVRLDMFNHKMALEKTFRKSLQELDADYLKKAFNAMSEESKNALIANAKLKDELQLQSIGVDNLMQRFSQQGKHYQKMKVENEILEQESHLRLQEVSSMKKAQLVASRTIEKLKDEVIKEEHEWKEQTSKVIEELRQENIHLQKLYEASQKRCNKWKARCLELTEREAQRRLSEQRTQTAPTSLSSWYSIPRTQSQPSLSQDSPASARTDVPINYNEMWSASLKNSNQRQHKVDLLKSRKAADSTMGSGSLQPASIDLERIAASNLEIRPRTLATQGDSSARKPHRLVASILPRPGQSMDSFNFTK